MRLDDDDDDDYEYAPPRSRGRPEREESFQGKRRSSTDKDIRIRDDRFGDDDRGEFKNRESETSYKERQEKEKDLHAQIKSTWLTPAEEGDEKGGNTITGKAKLDVMQVAVGAQMMTKHKAFMERSPLVISPRTWYMRKWDLVTLVLLLFTAVVTPVEVAFLETSLWSIMFWINRSVDALFIIDIFLNFFVAIIEFGRRGVFLRSRRVGSQELDAGRRAGVPAQRSGERPRRCGQLQTRVASGVASILRGR